LVLSTKRLVAAAKFLVAGTKILFVVLNFVAVMKSFFFREFFLNRSCPKQVHFPVMTHMDFRRGNASRGSAVPEVGEVGVVDVGVAGVGVAWVEVEVE